VIRQEGIQCGNNVILELAVINSEQKGFGNVANVWEQPTSYFDFTAEKKLIIPRY